MGSLHLATWEKELEHDPDRAFILEGIKNGFQLVNTTKAPQPCLMKNYTSAAVHSEAVEAEIFKELAEGRYEIMTEKPTIVSAMGAIPKSDGSVRIIHDCSRPKGAAVNDQAMDLGKQKYQTLHDAISLITPGSYLAKVDLKGAFRSCALHPNQYPFMGLQWKFTGNCDVSYIQEKHMCFGARAAPAIFHCLSQAIRRFMANRNIVIVAYQDDFLVIAPTKAECRAHYIQLIELLRTLGFYIAWSKLVDPTQRLVFLGVMIDTTSMSLELPDDKISKLHSMLKDFQQRKRATKRQLQKLAGKLAYAAHLVVKGGRCFLQRIFDTIRPLQQQLHKARLTPAFKADIHFWLSYLTTFNCKRFLAETRPKIHLFTDACQHGGGMIAPFDWTYIEWASDFPQFKHAHINVKETMTALLAIYRWAPWLQNSQLIIHSDNKTTEAVINKGACHNETIMDYLRGIFWLQKQLNFSIHCNYIAGTDNYMADSLSRLHQQGPFQHWYSVVSLGQPFSIPLMIALFQPHLSQHALISLLQGKPWALSLTKQSCNTGAKH